MVMILEVYKIKNGSVFKEEKNLHADEVYALRVCIYISEQTSRALDEYIYIPL